MQIEGWLSGGDLRSDGASDQVVEFILEHPFAIGDLIGALGSDNAVIRGRAADALEKITRKLPHEMDEYFDVFTDVLVRDETPMVRWHLAMLLGHLSFIETRRDAIGDVLLKLLDDPSVFVVSWVITSLSILALLSPEWSERVVRAIAPIQRSESIALRTRANKALAGLTGEVKGLPQNWVKSEHVRDLIHSGG